MSQPLTRLEQIAEILKSGKIPEPETVRSVLNWFGAERRGFHITMQIQNELDKLGISTEPDFFSAYIDSEVSFKLKPKQQAVPSKSLKLNPSQSIDPSTQVQGNPGQFEDPTYRVSRLKSANTKVVSVGPDATLAEAVTLMLTNDFSQLPVMIGDRDVKGIISWKSIGSKASLGIKCESVRECMEPVEVIQSDSSLFILIKIIIERECVLVRDQQKKISGLVTTSDLSEQFHQLGEPFLLLGEIENHVRRMLTQKLSATDFKSLMGSTSEKARDIQGASDLTFGDYVRLIENPSHWAALDLKLDRTKFRDGLDAVRKIRNDVMHFDPDGVPQEDLQTLRNFSKFLEKLREVGAT